MTEATVGLLFSDIEGSTRLLQELGPDYGTVLIQHRELLEAAFLAHRGQVQGTEGDSFFVTFPEARDAVAAALAGQRSLASHPWRPGAVVRVRMGVHVGEIQTVAGAIVGMAVHEAARIGAVGHGGQVLVSAVAAGLSGVLPEAAGWLDLGPQRLKDISEPVRLLQLTHADLASDFPPLRSQATGKNNLPAQVSGFIGREREIAEVHQLLVESRLLTVTGAGGAGKSRIALRVAAQQSGRFDDGVWFVDLAPVSDPGAVAQQVAGALGHSDLAAADLGEAVGQRTLLLLFDNCEHLVEPVADLVGDLLRRCPGISVLATSREPLGVQGEVAWRLPSLSDGDAMELLCTRARAVNSSFALTDGNRSAAQDVCRRLDAIPLALELAAARLGSLTLEQLASRLDQRFRLLAGGTRGGLARQRTLQATVDWSYALLSSSAQTVLRRLGVFVGGFNLEAAEAVCTTSDVAAVDVVDHVDQLVAKSLVTAEERDGAVRYRLLETIRHYALERLLQTDETVDARAAHQRWVVELTTEAGPWLWFGQGEAGESDWMGRLDTEAENLRAAFAWALDGGELSAATSMVVETMMWWIARGRSGEGLDLCQRLLAAGGSAEDRALVSFAELLFASHGHLDREVLARAIRTTGPIGRSSRPWIAPLANGYVAAWSIVQGDAASAQAAVTACRAAVAAARPLPHTVLGMALQSLSWAHMDAGELDAARTAADEGLSMMRGRGFSVGESRLSANLTHIAIRSGDLAAAWGHAERTVEAARRTSDTWMVIAGTRLLCQIAALRGDLGRARDVLVGLLDVVADVDSDQELAGVHRDIAWYALLEGDLRGADAHAVRGIELVPPSSPMAGSVLRVAGEAAHANGELGRAWRLLLRAARSSRDATLTDRQTFAMAIEGLGAIRMHLGDAANAALLLASATAHRPDEGARLEAEEAQIAQVVDAALAALGGTAFHAAWSDGAALELSAAFAVAEDMPAP